MASRTGGGRVRELAEVPAADPDGGHGATAREDALRDGEAPREGPQRGPRQGRDRPDHGRVRLPGCREAGALRRYLPELPRPPPHMVLPRGTRHVPVL